MYLFIYLFVYSFILVHILLLRADYLTPVLLELFHSVANRQQQKCKTEQRVHKSPWKKYSMARVMTREPEM